MTVQKLRLALLWATSPSSELKALGHGGQRTEDLVELTTDALAFARRERTDGRLDGFGHGGLHGMLRLLQAQTLQVGQARAEAIWRTDAGVRSDA